MLSVILQHNVPPRSEAIVWKGNVPNGLPYMVTHNQNTANAQNGLMISATDNDHFHENVQHQPSSSSRATPCENSIQASKHSDKNFRKNALVENLVDITVSIINEIWYNFPVHLNSQVIPLRLFIQETLRRSRTSWSTLQTALYYLMKIKPQIKMLWLHPDRWTLGSKDNVNENNNQGSDPATCGRRMFLASLIIASKYLQDRNYANNAWSKICGLPVQEINIIERRFLKLIDYNLFIGEEIYKRWTSILHSQIQNISGSTLSRSDMTAKNQQAVAQFEKTLQQAPECKVQG
ncbi:cyclin-domain-containing protein [Glomus cerebriforme]|uniref:Cyclin-domain-containing protein n=1 Tax=Glomus cerebriforme TaxID=658196 RepID=A0A397SV08_9GLOM|nr:cyclin-domain-containing protein [Glomus cerebriforme]